MTWEEKNLSSIPGSGLKNTEAILKINLEDLEPLVIGQEKDSL